MLGGLIMIAVLVIFPTMVIMGSVAIAAALGALLKVDADSRYEGSELLELTR